MGQDYIHRLGQDRGDISLNRWLLLLHLVMMALAGSALWWLWDYDHPMKPLGDFGFGFVFGVALYSLYWRIMYGYWPD